MRWASQCMTLLTGVERLLPTREKPRHSCRPDFMVFHQVHQVIDYNI